MSTHTSAPASVLRRALWGLFTFTVVPGILAWVGRSASLPADLATFPDVPAGSEGAEDIAFVQARGIVRGYPDGTYRPDALLTRAEFTKMVVLSLHTEAQVAQIATGPGVRGFPDVPDDAWFFPYVAFSRRQGILSGYPDGTFGPEKNITVAEAVKVFANVFALRPPHPVIENPWYLQYAVASAKHMPASMKEPGQEVNRRQLAQMLASGLRGRATAAQWDEGHAAAPEASPPAQPLQQVQTQNATNLQNAYQETLLRMQQQMRISGQNQQNPSQAAQPSSAGGTAGAGLSAGQLQTAGSATSSVYSLGSVAVSSMSSQPSQSAHSSRAGQASSAHSEGSAAASSDGNDNLGAVPAGWGTCQHADALAPSISGDGRYVAYMAYENPQVRRNAPVAAQIFLHDRHTGQTRQITGLDALDRSLYESGVRFAVAPRISKDGRYVFFTPSDNGVSAKGLLRYNRVERTYERISAASWSAFAVSDDGEMLTYSDAGCLFARDLRTNVDTFLGGAKFPGSWVTHCAEGVTPKIALTLPITNWSFSGDGNAVAYVHVSNAEIRVLNLRTGIERAVATVTDTDTPRLSRDASRLAYVQSIPSADGSYKGTQMVMVDTATGRQTVVPGLDGGGRGVPGAVGPIGDVRYALQYWVQWASGIQPQITVAYDLTSGTSHTIPALPNDENFMDASYDGLRIAFWVPDAEYAGLPLHVYVRELFAATPVTLPEEHPCPSGGATTDQ